MAEKKVGNVNYWRYSSDILGVFRLVPDGVSKFPSYKAGQYMALQRNDCRLTKKVVGDGKSGIPNGSRCAGRSQARSCYSLLFHRLCTV